MANGSRASAQARLLQAHYRTRQSGPLRCDGCRHRDSSFTQKQHGRYCNLHRAAVVTHGLCDAFGHSKPPPKLQVVLDLVPVQLQLPDADTDVLLFDQPDQAGQLGAYVGEDAEGPVWVDAHGEGIPAPEYWADIPRLPNVTERKGRGTP